MGGLTTSLRVRRLSTLALAAFVAALLLIVGITPAARADSGDSSLTVRVTTVAGAVLSGASVSAVRIEDGPLSVDSRTVRPANPGGPLLLDSAYTWAIRVDTAPGSTAANVIQYWGGASTLAEARPYSPQPGAHALTVALQGGSVSGVVQSALKKPLPNVDVHLYKWNGSWSLLKTAVTSATGAYAFASLEPGSYTTQYDTTRVQKAYVGILAGGIPVTGNSLVPSAIGRAAAFVVRSGAPVVYSPRLAVGGSITGRALAGGLPLAGVSVRAVALTGSPAAGWTAGAVMPLTSAASTANGSFVISGLPAGHYALSLKPAAGASAAWRDPYRDPAPLTVSLPTVLVSAGRATAAPAAVTSLAAVSTTVTGVVGGGDPTASGRISFGRPGDFDATARTTGISGGQFSLALGDGSWEYRADFDRVGTVAYLPVWGTAVVSSGGAQLDLPFDVTPPLDFSQFQMDNDEPVIVGSRLSITAASNHPTTSRLDYQWLRSGIPVFGARSADYTARGGDVGAELSVRVTITDLFDSLTLTQTTAPVLVGTGAAPENVTPPALSISGVPRPGTRLVAEPGAWSIAPLHYGYSWLRDGALIASGQAYVATVADAGHQLSVAVTPKRVGHADAIAVSSDAVTVLPLAAPVLKIAPKITAKALPLGAVQFTVVDGTWTPAAASSYTWPDESTGRTYTENTPGTAVSVTVTTTRQGYLPATRTILVRRGTSPTGNAAITGGPSVGGRLGVELAEWRTLGEEELVGYVYSWQRYVSRRWTAVGSAATYAPTALDVGRPLRLVLSVTSPRYTSAVRVLPAGTGALGPALTGTAVIAGPRVPLVAHSAAASWTGVAPTAVRYQWYRNGVAIARATAASYTPPVAFANSELKVRITATRAGYAAGVVEQTVPIGPAGVIGSLGDTVVAPGSVGSAVSVQASGWNIPAVTRGYEWQKLGEQDWSTVSTGSAFVPDSVGEYRLIETVTKNGYARASRESNVFAVGAGRPVAATAPVVSTVGLTSTVLVDIPAAEQVEYLWNREGAADAPSYTREPGDTLPLTVTVRATSSASDYSAEPYEVVLLAARGVIPAHVPTIGGQGRVGDAWTAPVSPLATVTRQWYSNGLAITGATAATFAPGAAYLGKKLTVRTVASQPDYLTSITTSAPRTVALGANTGSVLVAGVPKPAAVLTADTSGFGVGGLVFTYQWQSSAGGAFTSIAKATAKTYRPTVADIGRSLRVVVSAKRTGYAVGSAISVPVVVGDSGPLAAVLLPTLSGTAVAGTTLAVTAPSFTTTGITLGYRWLRNGIPIPGATAATYVTSAGQAGDSIAAEITARSPGYQPWVQLLDSRVLTGP